MRAALIITLSLCVFLGHALGQQTLLRFVHGDSDAPNVDVYIDGMLVPQWRDIAFETVTRYLPFEAGNRTIALIRTNATRLQEEGEIEDRFNSEDILLNPPVPFLLQEGQFHSLAFFGQRDQTGDQEEVGQEDSEAKRQLSQEFPTWAVYIDRIEPVDDRAQLRLIHLVPGFVPVSLSLQRVGREEQEAVTDLEFPMATEYLLLEPGAYSLMVRGGGEELLTLRDVQLMAGRVYTAWAFGLPLRPVLSEDNQDQY